MKDKSSWYIGSSNNTNTKFMQKSLSNLVGMVVMNTLAFPLQVVRTRLQTVTELLRQGSLSQPYLDERDCINRIMKFEGYAGFWKGNFANILRFMSNDVLNFMMKETIQLEVKRHGLASDGSLILNFVSASVGGILTLGFIYPMEYGRTRLTNEIVGKKSAFIILMETFTKEGLKGIYRGSLNYFISAAIFRAFYFGIFDSLKVRYPQNLRNKFCESYVGSVVAIYSVYPFDTIRKRMIMTSGKNYKYQGFVDCARKILQEQGFKNYYQGWKLSLVQAIGVAGSLVFLDQAGTEVKKKGGIQ